MSEVKEHAGTYGHNLANTVSLLGAEVPDILLTSESLVFTEPSDI